MTAGPRLTPLRDEEMSPEQFALTRGIVARTPHQNVYRTLVRDPPLYRTWIPFARYLQADSVLSPRDRELIILRTAWLCGAAYEWAQHLPLARAAGFSEAEIARVRDGPGAAGWSKADGDLIEAVDQLHEDQRLTEPAWSALASRHGEQAMIEILYTIGHYHMVAMILNGLKVQVDAGLQGF